ncbi:MULTISPECIES: LLM class F420-dependent oxidoreductase [unclassified Streptomyces]|uniref:LLM class F420-dependent oxidoreductase n=1 Tax=unclassified Streptomyces TaxID=2593676 RepID=UPI00381E40AE
MHSLMTDEGIRPDRLGRALEERGFNAMFVPEHTHTPVHSKIEYPMGGPMPRPYLRTYDPFVALSTAAAVTEKLLLGTGIAILPQRDVLQTAKEAASLDRLSGGRFLLGVGAGWHTDEMRDHGVDPRTRGARLGEQLAALKELWTKDEAEFHGEHIDFDPVYSWPKPVRTPPIHHGGDGPRVLARVRTHGDVWMPTAVADPADVPAQVAAADGLPVSVYNVPGDDERLIDAYVEAGVERLTLFLEELPEDQALTRLDSLTNLIERYPD